MSDVIDQDGKAIKRRVKKGDGGDGWKETRERKGEAGCGLEK